MKILTLLPTALIAALLSTSAAHADRITLTEENDGLVTRNDRDFTQGFRAAYTVDAVESESFWHPAYGLVNEYTPFFAGGERQLSYIIGQNIYTPNNIRSVNPDPADRPYAGFLYGGVSLMEDHNSHSLDHVELLVGVVGSASLAEEMQNGFHAAFDHTEANGWGYQLDNEPGVVLSVERKWRLHANLLDDASLGIEAIPEAGVTLGNIWTYGQGGVMLRMGSNLKADYGSVRIRPAYSGTDYFNPEMMDGWFGWNIYAGAQGRAVARNIFLDGNTFGSSRDVDKDNFTGSAVVGFSVFGNTGPRLDGAVIFCKQEFDTTRACSKYGGVNLSWGW